MGQTFTSLKDGQKTQATVLIDRRLWDEFKLVSRFSSSQRKLAARVEEVLQAYVKQKKEEYGTVLSNWMNREVVARNMRAEYNRRYKEKLKGDHDVQGEEKEKGA